MDSANMRRELRAACVAAGVPVVSPNELRHSCASYLSDQGVSHAQIADLLGHTTTRMVDTHYRHRLREVVDVAVSVEWASDR
jgi:integrase